MQLENLVIERNKLEQEILEFLKIKKLDFEVSTGVSILNIEIMMVESTALADDRRKYKIADVKASIDF